MFQLVAYAPDHVRRFPVHADELLIGSEPQCDVCLPYTGVAQRHARLIRRRESLMIEDLGSRKGVVVSGRRVREATLEVLDEIRIGSVTLLLEDVLPEPVERPAPPPREPLPALTPETLLGELARLSDWVLADAESRTPVEALLGDLLLGLGGGVLFLFQGELEDCGVKFVAASAAQWLGTAEGLLEGIRDELGAGTMDPLGGDPPRGLSFTTPLDERDAWVCCHRYTALERTYYLATLLPDFDPGPWSPAPALRSVGDLLILGLVHHVGHFEPILPGKKARENLILDPGLVVGESEAVKGLLEQLKSAVDPPVRVLLKGESGTGREMLARSLHLSGPNREGPFFAAACGGAKTEQIEADLFGAQIPGKEGPVRRQGKLSLADGGTLYLEDVDQLPLELQARLVRFLRSGEVEPAGSVEVETVEVRLIASSSEPLDALVARDRMRVDLAYRLSQVTIAVPSLRDRREELPLLIQSQINRYCHETGKRVQGISVKAFNALLSYDYPGNLPELAGIARQLVYLCPAGKPIDVNLLPDAVKVSPIHAAARIERGAELNLDRLVADCERAAIREALRRSRGNKSQAARELALSRNGLAMKMARLGLDG